MFLYQFSFQFKTIRMPSHQMSPTDIYYLKEHGEKYIILSENIIVVNRK